MGNIDFSRHGKLILQNPALRDYILHRLDNLTEDEKNKGILHIKLRNGDREYNMEITFGPARKAKLSNLQLA